MEVYQKMYTTLFNAVTDALEKIEADNQTPFFWTVTPPVFFPRKENGGRITRHLCRIDIRTCAKKEEFSFEKENIPLSRIPCTVQGKSLTPQGVSFTASK